MLMLSASSKKVVNIVEKHYKKCLINIPYAFSINLTQHPINNIKNGISMTP
jgi:hypothetical protein